MSRIQSFTPETIERIARAVREVLGDDKRRRPERRRKNHIPTPSSKLGKLDGNLAYNASATVSIFTGTPLSETDSGENVTAYPWMIPTDYQIVSSGSTEVVVTKINGAWYVTDSEVCPTEIP